VKPFNEHTAIYLKKQGASSPTYSHAVSNLSPYAKFNSFQFNPIHFHICQAPASTPFNLSN